MKTPTIIVGLGNPGPEYHLTRHNAGFLCTDFLVRTKHCAPLTPSHKFHAAISENHYTSAKCIIAQPLTFMNHSGRAAHALLDFYKVPYTSLIVIHDDLDLPFGTYTISHDKNAAGHNGVQDIINHIGTKEFTRIRIGIDNRSDQQRAKQAGSTYVLGRFTQEETDALPDIFTKIAREQCVQCL